MRKWILILLMVMVTMTIVKADPICERQIENGTSCRMLTPSISCSSYTYDIVNANTSAIIKDDYPLTSLNDTTYFFNFSETIGDYQVVLCDYTTRQIRVVEPRGDNVIIGVIIGLPMLLGLFFLIGAITLNDEEHVAMKIGLFIMSLFTFFMSIYLGSVAIIKYFDFPEMQTAVTWILWLIGSFFFVVISYFLVYLIIIAIHTAADRRDKRLKY